MSASHPAEDLSIGNDDQISQLSKLLPIHLKNDQEHQEKLEKLRNSDKYIYVLSWLYQCRGIVKLHNEFFDADLFEIELLNLVSPPPVDDSVLFINKLKVGLIVALRGGPLKNTTSEEFEQVFREWFGTETPLGGPVDENDNSEQLLFDYLFIESKIDVLYTAISYISGYAHFRAFIDRNQLTSDDLKPEVLHMEVTAENETVDYILMFDNTRLYKRITTSPELVVPKKRADAPADPEEHYSEEQFDAASVEYELVFKDIYKLDEYLKLIPKKNKKLRDLRAALASEAVVDSLFYAEIRKRKILSHRRKELQLANLLATRKKSTRIEARERERQREIQIERQKQEEEARATAEDRMERRRIARERASNSYVSPTPTVLSREERLLLRQARLLGDTQSPTESPQPTSVEDHTQIPDPQPESSEAIQSETYTQPQQVPEVVEPLSKKPKLEEPHKVPVNTAPEVPAQSNNQGQWTNNTTQFYPPVNADNTAQFYTPVNPNNPQQATFSQPIHWPNMEAARNMTVHNHAVPSPAQNPSSTSSFRPYNPTK